MKNTSTKWTVRRVTIPGYLLSLLASAAFWPSAHAASTVVAWGQNDYGETNVPAGLTNVVAAAAGYTYSLAIRNDGTVTGWGSNSANPPGVPPGLSGVIAISAGASHKLALRNNGTIIGWGLDDYGQSKAPAGLGNVVAVGAGGLHSIALKSDGTVVAWGNNFRGQRNVPVGLSNVVAIAAGGNHNLALKSDGTVVAWGNNHFGQSTIPADLSNVVAIAASPVTHNVVLKADGTVVGWGGTRVAGIDQAIPPAGISNVVAIAAGGTQSLALKRDGTVVAWGWGSPGGEAEVPAGLSNVVSIAAGFYHNVIVTRTFSESPPWPLLAQQLQSVRKFAGDAVTFSVPAPTGGTWNYQWQFNGADLPNQTNPSLTLDNLRITDSGRYSAVVSEDGLIVKRAPFGLAVVLPSLRMGRSGNDITLSWPASAPGYRLEAADNVAQGFGSLSVTPTVVDGETAIVTLPCSAPQNFFRLRKP